MCLVLSIYAGLRHACAPEGACVLTCLRRCKLSSACVCAVDLAPLHIQHTAGDAFARQAPPPATAGEAEAPEVPPEALHTERSGPTFSGADGSGGGGGGSGGGGGGGGGASCGEGSSGPADDVNIDDLQGDWLSRDNWLVCSQ